jgi:hypothetical protein
MRPADATAATIPERGIMATGWNNEKDPHLEILLPVITRKYIKGGHQAMEAYAVSEGGRLGYKLRR